MKKLKMVDGARKMYNTATGKLLHEVKSGKGDSKLHEKLMMSYRGEYFLHGIGGKLTRWNGTEDIVVLTPKQADVWRKKNAKK